MQELKNYKPIAEAVGLLLAPHVEVVIHDLKTNTIAYIYNNLSKRKVGDPSLLEEMPAFQKSKEVFPPYLKVNWDGRKIKSVSALLKDRQGKAIGLFCINLDISSFEALQHVLFDFIGSKLEKPDLLFKNDWKERVNTFITAHLKENGLTLTSMTRNEKKNLLLELLEEGAFEEKNAAAYIADLLHISRATVYNYLKEKE